MPVYVDGDFRRNGFHLVLAHALFLLLPTGTFAGELVGALNPWLDFVP